MSEGFLFANEETLGKQQNTPAQEKPWKIMIVDDDPAVHQVTKMVMSGFSFDDRSVKFLSAFSGREAKDMIAEEDDVALILLDVVMEEDDAGLDVARYIRQELHNNITRIVLRTGQPGQAPEDDVIRNYDINDYKDKTELTKTKLVTLFYSALRSYRDICMINESRGGLHRVIQAITSVHDPESLKQFSSAILGQILNLLSLPADAVFCHSLSTFSVQNAGNFKVMAATGQLQELLDNDFSVIDPRIASAFGEALDMRRCHYGDDYFIGFYQSARGSESLLYVKSEREIPLADRQLLELYADNVANTYDSLLLTEKAKLSQKSLLHILSGAIKSHSVQPDAHVRRVGDIAALLASESGLNEFEVELIRMAAPLHDAGNVALANSLVCHTGVYSDDERQQMQQHTVLGQQLLSHSDEQVMQLAAIIAAQHHEAWDGNGYPGHIQGENIHIAGRITALADTVDALCQDRPDRPAFSFDDAFDFIKQASSQRFDPRLVEVLLVNRTRIEAILSEQ